MRVDCWLVSALRSEATALAGCVVARIAMDHVSFGVGNALALPHVAPFNESSTPATIVGITWCFAANESVGSRLLRHS